MIGKIRMTVGSLVVVASVSLAAAMPGSARAANSEMGDVLVDGFYGGLIGALVGAAVMVLTEDPGDHLQYMTNGAAIGVLAGTAYGLYNVGRNAMVSLDRGRVAWHVPAIEAAVRSGAGQPRDVTLSTALVRIRFP